jgi:hypothetical protein
LESVLLDSKVLFCGVLHRPLYADGDKIPGDGTSTYILRLSGCNIRCPTVGPNVHVDADLYLDLNQNDADPIPGFTLVEKSDFFYLKS